MISGTDFLETDRLVLRRIAPGDFEFFARIHADPEVARYIGHGRPRTMEETHDWLTRTLVAYEALGLGQLAVLRKSDGAPLGRCGLSDLAVEVATTPGVVPRCWWSRTEIPAGVGIRFRHELGYTFDRACWGAGYATEAAGRVFRYARDTARLSSITSLIHPHNTRSLKVATRFGAAPDGKVESLGRTFNTYIWPAARS